MTMAMAMAMAVQFSGIRCGKEKSNVSISNAETKERLKLKQVFHEANKRCLSSPMDGVSFTIDDFHAALDFHSRSPLETKSMYPISNTDSESELRIGCVVSGSVESVKAYGAFVKIGGMNMNGLLHHTQISHHHFSDIANVVQPGDTLKVMILSHDLKRRRISLSTKHLEPTPGDMIHNPNLVFEKADEMAHTFSQRIAQAQAMAHAHLLRFQPEESGLNRSFGGISASLTSELPPEVVVTDAPSTE